MAHTVFDNPEVANHPLVVQFRDLLEKRYHHLHPFNVAMHEGTLSAEALQGWIANRYYYQENIPVKDAFLLTKLPTPYRREWITRIVTHDGACEGQGGLEAWLRLGEAAGVPRAELISRQHLLPGVRFAVDAYVHFVEDKPWLEGVASSLTELFAPIIMQGRTVAFEEHYPWIEPEGLAYFRARVNQAPKEASHAISIILEHAQDDQTKQKMLDALHYKCDILWCLLDAVQIKYT